MLLPLNKQYGDGQKPPACLPAGFEEMAIEKETKLDRKTIRGIDPNIYAEARQIVRDNPGETLGSFVSDALEFYIESLPYHEE